MNFVPNLILVDGSSFMFRAYHSSLRNNFRNSRNEPIGALMFYARMLTSLRQKYEHIPCVTVFDAPVHCFRYDIYPQYKANRKKMDEDLQVQCPKIHEVSKAMGCDFMMVEGFEADDVIGTYATIGSSLGQNVLICTGDKDLYQLVNDHVIIENTMTDEIIDKESGRVKYGVVPELMVDYLALVGDSSDNIPGMAGTGPKTAEMVLNGIGSIDEIEQNLQATTLLSFRGAKNFPAKFIQNLDDIKLSRILATIRCDVPVPIKYEDLKWREPNYLALAELYKNNGLKSLYDSVNSALQKVTSVEIDIADQPKDTAPCDTRVVYDKSLLDEMISKIASENSFVFVTFSQELGLGVKTLLGFGCALSNVNYYLPIGHRYLGVPNQLTAEFILGSLRRFFEDNECVKVIFNVKDLMHQFKDIGISWQGKIFDPQLEAWMCDSVRGAYDLDALIYQDLNQIIPVPQELARSGKNKKDIIPGDVAIDVMRTYSGLCLSAISNLQEKYFATMQDEQLVQRYLTQYLPMVRVLYEMESVGVLVSVPELQNISHEFSERLLLLEERIYSLANRKFNIASPKQVAQVLFDELHLLPQEPTLKKKVQSGKYTTNEEMLSDLATNYDIASDILSYRALSKLKNTYADVLPKLINDQTGRIHTTFHLNGTSTGRLSSSDPNLQNIPIRSTEGKRIRRAFIARPGYKIIAADYSQIELRILAHLSGDEALVNSFLSGEDIHRRTAAEILGIPFDKVSPDQRRSAKAVNFGILYGMSAFGLAKQLKIDRKVAQAYIDGYFRRYGSIKDYLDKVVADAKVRGYVTAITGRRILIKDIKSNQPMLVKNASRVATNAPMQGSAADIIQLAMIQVEDFIRHEAQKDSLYLLLQVHDELVLEVKEEFAQEYAQKIAQIMSSAFELKVPLDVGVGIADNWEQAH